MKTKLVSIIEFFSWRWMPRCFSLGPQDVCRGGCVQNRPMVARPGRRWSAPDSHFLRALERRRQSAAGAERALHRRTGAAAALSIAKRPCRCDCWPFESAVSASVIEPRSVHSAGRPDGDPRRPARPVAPRCGAVRAAGGPSSAAASLEKPSRFRRFRPRAGYSTTRRLVSADLKSFCPDGGWNRVMMSFIF